MKKKATKKKATRTWQEQGKTNRTKGASFERKIVNAFKKASPLFDAVRGSQASQDHRSGDVMVSILGNGGDLTPRYLVECKDGKAPNWQTAMGQAVDKRKWNKGSVPLAITHKLGDRKIYVHIELNDFLDMV